MHLRKKKVIMMVVMMMMMNFHTRNIWWWLSSNSRTFNSILISLLLSGSFLVFLWFLISSFLFFGDARRDYYSTPCEFFIAALADGLSLECECQQVSRTLLSILVDLNSAVDWMVSIRPQIFDSSSLLTLRIIPFKLLAPSCSIAF